MNKGQNKTKTVFKREDMKVNQTLISLSILVSQVSVLPARTITPDLLGEQGLEMVAMAVEVNLPQLMARKDLQPFSNRWSGCTKRRKSISCMILP